jgi:hypothetical protein
VGNVQEGGDVLRQPEVSARRAQQRRPLKEGALRFPGNVVSLRDNRRPDEGLRGGILRPPPLEEIRDDPALVLAPARPSSTAQRELV